MPNLWVAFLAFVNKMLMTEEKEIRGVPKACSERRGVLFWLRFSFEETELTQFFI
jgi:hypothetical protein